MSSSYICFDSLHANNFPIQKFVQCFLYAEYINVSLDIDTNLNNYKHEYIDA